MPNERRYRKFQECWARYALPNLRCRRIANLVEAGIAKRQTASVYLKRLVEIGVLQEEQAGREKLFVHPRLIRLLTEEDNEIVPIR